MIFLVTLVQVAIALVALAVIAFLYFSSTNKARHTTCTSVTKKIELKKKEYDTLVASGNSYDASKACKELNELIDKYNKNKCEELTGVTFEKENCK